MKISLEKAMLAYAGKGFSTLPLNMDNRPVLRSWKHLQEEVPSSEQIQEIAGKANGSACGIGVIAGKVSGNVEVVDIDCKNDVEGGLWEKYSTALKEALGERYDDLVIAETRSKGYHIFYRGNFEIPGNDKWARRPITEEEKKKDPSVKGAGKTLIETRGEGGYVAAAPTDNYRFVQGDFRNLPILSFEEREKIRRAAGMFHTAPLPVDHEARQLKNMRDPFVEVNKPEPLQWFDKNGDVIALLESEGWAVVGEEGERTMVRRPGESTNAQSGNYKHRRLVIHSSNTDFEPEIAYAPSEVYAVLKCGGDIEKAIGELAILKAKEERGFFVKKESTALRLVGFDEMLSDDEPPRWIIHRFINEGSFVQIFGEPEAGKSFVAIDWGLCIASGRDWAGHRIFSPGPVVYIAGEGTKDFNKRIKAWVKENGGASGKDLPFYRFNHATALLDEEKLIEAGKLIEAVATKHGKVSAVVIDTLNRNFGGGDENSTKDMTAAVTAIDKIIRKFGCSVIVVHHTGHGDKTRSRGSGVLHAANDFDYKVERRGQYATVSCTKAKDFERPMEVSFRMEKVPVGRDADTGEDIDSLVFRKVDGVEVELAEMEEAHAEKSVSDTAIRILLSLLHDSDAVSEDEWRDKLFVEWSREEPDAKKGALLKRFQRVKKDPRLIAQGEKGALFFKVKTKQEGEWKSN